MVTWNIKRTDTFLPALREYKNNHELLRELDKKIRRLQEDPTAIGGELGGRLHGKKSTRLSRKFRLIFSVDERTNTVYLEALDHRKEVYSAGF